MEQKDPKNIRKSKCVKCGKDFSVNKLIFNFCSKDRLCLNCYKKQFNQIPAQPIPFLIKDLKKLTLAHVNK
jgi:hypothetical protein